MTIRRDRAGIWRMTIGHDDGCPQLTFRQRHGMTTSVALVAEPGRTISRELVAEVTSALAEDPDVRGVRVATTPATTWQERQALTRATGEP